MVQIFKLTGTGIIDVSLVLSAEWINFSTVFKHISRIKMNMNEKLFPADVLRLQNIFCCLNNKQFYQ